MPNTDHRATDTARVGSRRVWVAFACNDDHGQYCGRAFGFSVCGRRWDLDYDHDDPFHGRVFKVDWNLMTFTMHRVSYPFTASKEWFGSMAWTAFQMKRPAAVRLLLAVNAQPRPSEGGIGA